MISDLWITPAVLEDVDALAAVERKAYQDAVVWDREGIERCLRKPNIIFLKAQLNGDIIGKTAGIVYHGRKNKSLQVHDLSVLAQYRRRGIATWLLTSLECKARIEGCVYSALHVRSDNPGAILLYLAFGYRMVGKPRWNTGMSRMKKNLEGD